MEYTTLGNVVGAIDRNPADGVILPDEKKIAYCRILSFRKGQNLYPISGIRFCPCRFYGRILMIVK